MYASKKNRKKNTRAMKLGPLLPGYLDLANILVYEEMTRDFSSDYKHRSQVPWEGGAASRRLPYVKRVYFIFPAERQFYLVNESHAVPHFSISPSQYKKARRIYRNGGAEVVDITSDCSHVDIEGHSLQVWNEGTPEWKDQIQDHYENFSFADIYQACKGLKPGNRGNRTKDIGVTSQDYSVRDPETHVSLPGLFAETADYKHLLVQGTQMMLAAGAYDFLEEQIHLKEQSRSGQRYQRDRFARSIHMDNLVATGTMGITINEHLTCHMDSKNGTQQLHHALGCANMLLCDYQDPKNPVLVRLMMTFFDRKASEDYMTRVTKASPMIQELGEFYQAFPAHRQKITSHYWKDLHIKECIEGILFTSDPHTDLLASNSIYIDLVYRFCHHFPVTERQYWQIIQAMNIHTSPFPFVYILTRWMESGEELPPGNLCFRYCEESLLLCSGCCGGPVSRFQPFANVPFSKGRSMLDTEKVMQICSETIAYLAEKPTLSNNAFRLLVKKFSKLQHCGDFVGQRMLTVVVATGVIPRAELCQQTYIANSTLTYSKVIERYGYSSWEDLDRGVRAAAAALGITPRHVDQLACEKFREDPKVDCHIPGMSVWDLVEGDRTGVTAPEPMFVRIAQDGSTSHPVPITFVEDPHPYREPNLERYPDFSFPDARSKKIPEGVADQWNWTCYPNEGTKATHIPGHPKRCSSRPKRCSSRPEGSIGQTKKGKKVYRSIHFETRSEGQKYFMQLSQQRATLNQMRRKFARYVEKGNGCYSTTRVTASIPITTEFTLEPPPKPQLPRVRSFPDEEPPQVVDQYHGLYDPEFLGIDIKTFQKTLYGKNKPSLPKETQPMIPTAHQKEACKSKYGFVPTQFSARPMVLAPAVGPTSTDGITHQETDNQLDKKPPKKAKPGARECYDSSTSDSTEEKKWSHNLRHKCKTRRSNMTHTTSPKRYGNFSLMDADSTASHEEDTASYDSSSTRSGCSSEHRKDEDSSYTSNDEDDDSTYQAMDEDDQSSMSTSQSDTSLDSSGHRLKLHVSGKKRGQSTRQNPYMGFWEDEYCSSTSTKIRKGIRGSSSTKPDSCKPAGYQPEWDEEYCLCRSASGQPSKGKTKGERNASTHLLGRSRTTQRANKRKVRPPKKSHNCKKKRSTSRRVPRDVSVITA